VARSNDPLVVQTDRLAAILEDWMERQELKEADMLTERAASGGNATRRVTSILGSMPDSAPPVARMTPRNKLAFWSGVDLRLIKRILDRTYETTSLSVADDLLTALGEHFALSIGGELPVVKSPRWSTERFIAYMRRQGADPRPYLQTP
jgi:hypothetical protein